MNIDLHNLPNLTIWKSDENFNSLVFEGNVEELTGYSKEDFIHNPTLWRELIHPDDKVYIQNALSLLKEGKQSCVDVNFRIIRKGNAIRNIMGAVSSLNSDCETGYKGYYVDISHRNQEHDLETHKKSLLNLLGDSIAKSFDLEKNRVDRVNEVLGSLGKITNADRVYIFDKKSGDNNRPILSQNYEWCRDGIESQMSNDVVFDVDLKELVPRWYSKLVESKSYLSGIVRHFPGEERDILEPQDIISILVTPIWYGNEFFGFIGFDDCTEERVWNDEESKLLTVFGSLMIASWIYEDSLETVESQLKEVKKLQSEREQFLKMVSHQFKTPLSVIRLNTELLSQFSKKLTGGELSFVEKKIQRIESSISKFEELIEAILVGNSAHLLEITPEPLNVNEWFEEFAAQKTKDFNEIKELRIRPCTSGPKHIKLSFSQKTLDYIMDTLFSNAVKYRGASDASIDISYKLTGDSRMEVTIRDKGIGIREEEIPKIATPFYRANDVINISGTGIGLSMVKDSLAAVGGTFDIDSEYDRYTSVKISIPIEEMTNGK